MPKWRMKGEYIKNCSCLATCPCDTIGYPAPYEFCEGVFGMNITEGNYGNVPLKGLRWIGLIHFPGAAHEGNGQLQHYIDERANQAQRDALTNILAGKEGGPIFEIFSSLCPTVFEPQFVPIEFDFDKRRRRARVSSPGLFATVSEPLRVPPTGEEQRVQVRLPGGFEYRQMEVANASYIWTGGTIKMKHSNTHSSLATVDHTNEGLVA